MTSVIAPMCVLCTHLERLKDGGKCTAFPYGIPHDIVFEAGDHTVPREGDHGIQFEPSSDAAKALFLRRFPEAHNPPT